jgi:hypothetical protein
MCANDVPGLADAVCNLPSVYGRKISTGAGSAASAELGSLHWLQLNDMLDSLVRVCAASKLPTKGFASVTMTM